jgi:hypothetical protein
VEIISSVQWAVTRRMREISALTLLSLILLSVISDAQQYPLIPELSDEDLSALDLNDASVSDWKQIHPSPAIDLSFFFERQVSVAMWPTEFAHTTIGASVWIGWHRGSSRIYVAIERFDDAFYPSTDVSLARRVLGDTQIEFSVDGDLSGGIYQSGDLTSGNMYLPRPNDESTATSVALNSAAQKYRIAFSPDGGGDIHLLGQPGHWASVPPYSDIGGGIGSISEETGHTFWTIEFYVTVFDELSEDASTSRTTLLRERAIVGLDLLVADMDSPTGDRDSMWQTSPNPLANYDAGFLKRWILQPLVTTTIGRVGWGVIKRRGP